MAAGVPEKSPGAGEIIWQEADQGPEGQKGQEGHEVLAVARGHRRKIPCADRSEPRAEPVHVIHEIERIDHGKDPEDRQSIMQCRDGNEQRDPDTAGGNEAGNQKLAGKLRRRPQLVFIIQNTQQEHADGPAKNAGQLPRPTLDAITQQVPPRSFEPGNPFGHRLAQPQQDQGRDHRQSQAGHDSQTSRKGDGTVVDLPVAWIIDEADADTPTPP